MSEEITGFIRYPVDMKFTPTGKALSTFTVYDTESGAYGWKLRVVTWDDLAEACNRELGEGAKVFCKGNRKTQYWNNDEGIQSREEFTASRIWELDGQPNEMNRAIEILIDKPRHVL